MMKATSAAVFPVNACWRLAASRSCLLASLHSPFHTGDFPTLPSRNVQILRVVGGQRPNRFLGPNNFKQLVGQRSHVAFAIAQPSVNRPLNLKS
jgi:hypothetical protein